MKSDLIGVRLKPHTLSLQATGRESEALGPYLRRRRSCEKWRHRPKVTEGWKWGETLKLSR